MQRKIIVLFTLSILFIVACTNESIIPTQHDSISKQPAINPSNTPSVISSTAIPNGRSAGISLIPEASGTATPNIPPTLPPLPKQYIYPAEWYWLNASDGSDYFSMTVVGWGLPPSGEIKSQLEPGNKLVMVEAVLHNKSNSYIKIWSEGQASLKDLSGNKFSSKNIFFIYEKKDSGDLIIAPGEHFLHTFIFSVPENTSGLTFQYDICSGNSSDLCGQLLSIPLVQDTSGKSPSGTNLPDPGIYKFGEVITLEDRVYAVIRWEAVSLLNPEKNDEGNPFGTNLLKVRLVTVNLGNQNIETGLNNNGVSIDLKDGSGRYFPKAMGHGMDAQIEPDEKAIIETYFHVPPGSMGLELVLDSVDPVKGWPTITRIFINLGDQPALAETSLSQMPGFLAPNAVPFGQSGKVADSQFTVIKVDYPSISMCDIPPGNRAVLVTVNEMNTGNQMLVGWPYRVFLKDSQANFHDTCDQDDDGQTVGELQPNESRNIQYSFILPDFQGDLWLMLNNASVNKNKVFFLLK